MFTNELLIGVKTETGKITSTYLKQNLLVDGSNKEYYPKLGYIIRTAESEQFPKGYVSFLLTLLTGWDYETGDLFDTVEIRLEPFITIPKLTIETDSHEYCIGNHSIKSINVQLLLERLYMEKKLDNYIPFLGLFPEQRDKIQTKYPAHKLVEEVTEHCLQFMVKKAYYEYILNKECKLSSLEL